MKQKTAIDILRERDLPIDQDTLGAMEEYAAQFKQQAEPQLISFDLEIALKHPERVRTRDGKNVNEIQHFKSIIDSQQLFCVINGSLYSFFNDGTYDVNCTSDSDLFLIAKRKLMWVNVYKDTDNYWNKAEDFSDSYEQAHATRDTRSSYIATVPITIPVK